MTKDAAITVNARFSPLTGSEGVRYLFCNACGVSSSRNGKYEMACSMLPLVISRKEGVDHAI